MAYNANGLYSHKAQTSDQFNSSAVSNKEKLACHAYGFEDFLDSFDSFPALFKKDFHNHYILVLTYFTTGCS